MAPRLVPEMGKGRDLNYVINAVLVFAMGYFFPKSFSPKDHLLQYLPVDTRTFDLSFVGLHFTALCHILAQATKQEAINLFIGGHALTVAHGKPIEVWRGAEEGSAPPGMSTFNPCDHGVSHSAVPPSSLPHMTTAPHCLPRCLFTSGFGPLLENCTGACYPDICFCFVFLSFYKIWFY